MIKILALFILLFCQSCQINNKNEQDDSNIIINNFLLKQHSSSGDLNWKIISQKASFNQYNKKTTSYNPNVVIYSNNIPVYNIVSEELNIDNNGKLIKFSRDVIVKILTNQEVDIFGNLLLWEPDNNNLNFKGKTKFKRYNLRSKENLIIETNSVNWNTNNGIIEAKGPIKGKTLINTSPEYLFSDKIIGNTKEGYLEFLNCMYKKENQISSKSDKCKIYWTTVLSPKKEFSEAKSNQEVFLHSLKNQVNTKILVPNKSD